MNRRQYQPFSRQDIERVLERFSAREVPPQFYQYRWAHQDGKWNYVKRQEEIGEVCYVLGINDHAGIIVYSTIDRRTEWSRDKGEDAIRLVVVDQDMKPRAESQQRINRIGTWPENLRHRIWEYIQHYKKTTSISSDGTARKQIRPGAHVSIVQKQDQPTGALTAGIVQDILTSSPMHPRGIKVRLTTGQVGRVQKIHWFE